MRFLKIFLAVVLLFNTCFVNVLATETRISSEHSEMAPIELYALAEDWMNDETENIRSFSLNDDIAPYTVAKAGVVDSGTIGSISWKLDNNGVLTISGNGSMQNYYRADAPWIKHKYKINSVVIEDGITHIGDFSFADYDYTSGNTNYYDPGCSLKSITIPNTVRSIGKGTFFSCSGLTDIRISKHITSIGDEAFSYCDGLKNIDVATANPCYCDVDGVMYNKTKTTLIKVPPAKFKSYSTLDTTTVVDEYSFRGCENLKELTLTSKVKTIGYRAFYDCDSLGDVYYTGSETDWNKISISSENSELLRATKHFNYKRPTDIVLSKTEMTALPYTCQSIYVYKSDGVTPYDKSFKVTSSKPKVVSTSKKGNEIILSFDAIDSATITVEATDGSGAKEICNVTVVKRAEDDESDQDRALLERLALCQLVYSHKLSEYDTVSELLESEGKLFEKDYDNTMFYLSNSEIAWKDFLKIYINDYKIKMLKDDPSTGFFAAAFESPEGDIIIAYRGSEGNHEWRGVFMVWDENEVDWWGADLPMFLGIKTSQFSQALNFYDDVKREYGNQNIRLTGHSLGGALSSYVALNKKVYTDNINGATGLIYNRNLLIDEKQYPVNYGGFDKYITENFSVHDDLANNVVTRLRNFGEFNYNEYADSTTKNKKDKFDYHSISSVLDYINGSFAITEKVNEHIAEPDIRYGVRYIGTSEDNTYVAPITKKNYPSSLPGSNQPAYKELPVAPPNHYVLSGDGDDNITLPEGGDDTLIGNAGNDTLNGGAGNDIYVYGGDFGNDTIIDPSGKDKLVFTDRTLSEIAISGNKITCGSNTIEISTESKRTADFTVVDKDKNTQTIEFPKVSLYSLRRIVAADTTKGIKIFGNAEVEIYDAAEELIETICINEETETSVEYKDYGMVTYSPQAVGLTLPPEGYIVKIKSDESVSVWSVSDADNPIIAKQTSIENQDLSDGSMIVINTGEMVEEQLSVKIVNGDEEHDVYSEVPENFAITANKTNIKTGETITMSVPETFADSVVWECTNNNVIITKNENLSVSVIGYTSGEETVKAYLPNDESYSAEFSFEITEDSAPTVVVSSKEEVYDGTEIATDSVVFDVSMADGYDAVVFDTFSPYSQVEGTNMFVINSVGDHSINIYCENSETGARTKAFTFEFSQDNEVPEITGVEDGDTYYTDRIIEVSDTAIDTIYINGELREKEAFIISDVGDYTITATDTAGNTTEISFEIKVMPSSSTLSIADSILVPQIRNDFEEVKYSLSEERMNELEVKISALELVSNNMYIVTVYENEVTKAMTIEEFNDYTPTEKEGYVFVGWYLDGEHSKDKEVVYLDTSYGKDVCLFAWYVPENELIKVSTSNVVYEYGEFTANISFEYVTCDCDVKLEIVDTNNEVVASESVAVNKNATSATVSVPFDTEDEAYHTVIRFLDEDQKEIGTAITKEAVCRYNGFLYLVKDDNTAEIVGYQYSSSELFLPLKISNYSISSIGADAFKNNNNLSKIIIPDTITQIGNNAFEGCTNLKTICFIGSEEQWVNINTANDNSYEGIDVVCNYTSNIVTGYLSYVQYGGNVVSGEIYVERCYKDCIAKIEILDEMGNVEKTSLTNISTESHYKNFGMPLSADNRYHTVMLTFVCEDGCCEYSSPYYRDFRAYTSVLYEDDYVYTIDDGKAVILGYEGASKEVEIPEKLAGYTVTRIGAGAFENTNITKVALPSTIETIEPNAFAYCSSLTEINIDNEKYISVDGVVFNKEKTELVAYPCGKSDMSYNIPSGVETILSGAFNGCFLQTISMPESLKSIQPGAMNYCRELYLILYEGSEDDWYNLLNDTWNNEALFHTECIFDYDSSKPVKARYMGYDYYDGVLYGGIEFYYIFQDCTALINIYNSTTGVLEKTCELEITTEDMYKEFEVDFQADGKWHDIVISFVDNTSDKNALGGCVYREFFAERESFAEGDYAYCIVEETAEIVEYFGSEEIIELPDTLGGYPVTSIADYGFAGSSVSEITIPEHITSIGEFAFEYCHNLSAINVAEENSNYSSVDGNLYNKDKTDLIYYAIGKEDSEFVIPDTVTKISSGAFAYAESLDIITIPTSVSDIGDFAFARTSVSKADIPASVNNIGNGIFEGCQNLESITVSDNNTSFTTVDGVLFNKDKTILLQYPAGNENTTYEIPSGTTTIAANSFNGTMPQTIIIPKSVKTIEPKAMEYMEYLNLILYCGSEIEWNKLIEEAWRNETLEYVDIIFDYNENMKVNGKLISCYYENETVTANVRLNYIMEDCKVMLAIYDDDGRMITLTDGVATVDDYTVSISCPADESYVGCNIKVMFWNNLNNLKPVGNVVTGEVKEMIFESQHPYEDYCDETQVYTYNGECESISITFSYDTQTESGYDYIYIYDVNDNEIGRYCGTELSGRTVTILGNRFKIRLTSDGSSTYYGYKVDKIVINN